MSLRTIKFQDRGQDFLEWDITANNVVVNSRPFQRRIWAGYVVLAPTVGERPKVVSRDGEIRELNYPIVAIEEAPA